jgi:hypothetical protein
MGLIYDILVDLPENYSDSGVFVLWHMFPKHSQEGKSVDGLQAEMDLRNKITLYLANNLPCTTLGEKGQWTKSRWMCPGASRVEQ